MPNDVSVAVPRSPICWWTRRASITTEPTVGTGTPRYKSVYRGTVTRASSRLTGYVQTTSTGVRPHVSSSSFRALTTSPRCGCVAKAHLTFRKASFVNFRIALHVGRHPLRALVTSKPWGSGNKLRVSLPEVPCSHRTSPHLKWEKIIDTILNTVYYRASSGKLCFFCPSGLLQMFV